LELQSIVFEQLFFPAFLSYLVEAVDHRPKDELR
jgi:hypothetical protein